MARIFLTIAALLGGSSVAIGAFGYHALKTKLATTALDTFQTAARYQMYHALALAIVALLLLSQAELGQAWLTAAGYSFILGTLIFSGSLYMLSLSDLKILGAIAPIGGLGFIIGWACLAIAAWVGKG